MLIGALILVALGSLAISVPGDHTVPAGARWFLLVGGVVYAAVIYVFGLLPSAPTLRPASWAAITLMMGLAIRRVATGERVVDPALAAAALAQGESPVTDRESEVLAAAASHDAIADVAARLHLSPGTVRNHLSAAIQKLGARNRGEAVQIAQQKGWL